tara:strand:+ start:330 stop:488 length:159 start_codon:yes stop_codon:yes gene_type:complete
LDYLSRFDESFDKNYSPSKHKYRKELRRMDKGIKAQGSIVDWDGILNDLCNN